jgi:ABC-type tungstate transport system permease subunit
VAVANPQRMGNVHEGMARRFAEFLRLPDTQQWIGTWGVGQIDSLPVFFPVTLPG